MKTRRYRHTAFTLGIFLILAGTGCGNSINSEYRSAPNSNVLLITIDTLRADHVGVYGAGGEATPMMDRLAQHGVRFSTAISPAPLTLPAHASIFTGLNPPRHGVRHNGLFALSEDQNTLAEHFQDAGYQTAAIVGAIVLADSYGLGQGFDFYHDRDFTKRAGLGGYVERRATDVTDRALEWLRSAQRPYFLWVHYYDPHRDFEPPPPYSENPDPYAGEVRYVDAEIERLLDGLAFPKMLDNTLVVLTADHGESLGEHGENAHAYTLYDASLRVPLLLAGPGVPVDQVVDNIAGLIDIAPTLLRLTGLESLGKIDGVDLTARWRNSNVANRTSVYSETLAPRLDHGWAPLHSVRTERHRYVRAPRPELYDLSVDPDEEFNLLESGSGATDLDRNRLDAVISAALSKAIDTPVREIDPQTRQQLADLGYELTDSPHETGLDPKDGLPLKHKFEDAKTAFIEGNLEKASALVTEVLAQSPRSADAHALLGRIRSRQEQFESALAEAQQAVALAPNNANHRASYAMIALHQGHTSLAVEQLRAGIALDTNIAALHIGLLWVKASGGNLEAAAAHEKRALELAPGDVQTLTSIGTLWNQLGQPAHAFAAFERAHALEPNLQWLNLELGLLALQLGFDSAPYLETASALLRTPDAGNRLAIAYADAGLLERALKLLEDLIAAHPQSEPVQQNLSAMQAWASDRTSSDAMP
jgi:arylsulfatase A-like enzyme/Tfp pilus assembly protein PilF